jgi:hypothetical protein
MNVKKRAKTKTHRMYLNHQFWREFRKAHFPMQLMSPDEGGFTLESVKVVTNG